MKLRGAPKSLTLRVRKYCFHCRELSKVANEHFVLSAFSRSLRNEMLLSVYSTRIQKISYFKAAPVSCLSALCELLKSVVFGPNDVLISDLKLNSSCMMINKGRVQEEYNLTYSVTFGNVLRSKTGNKDSFLGWRALLSAGVCGEATYRAMGFVEVSAMSASAVRGVLDRHSEVKLLARRIVARGLWKKVLYVGSLSASHDQRRVSQALIDTRDAGSVSERAVAVLEESAPVHGLGLIGAAPGGHAPGRHGSPHENVNFTSSSTTNHLEGLAPLMKAVNSEVLGRLQKVEHAIAAQSNKIDVQSAKMDKFIAQIGPLLEAVRSLTPAALEQPGKSDSHPLPSHSPMLSEVRRSLQESKEEAERFHKKQGR